MLIVWALFISLKLRIFSFLVCLFKDNCQNMYFSTFEEYRRDKNDKEELVIHLKGCKYVYDTFWMKEMFPTLMDNSVASIVTFAHNLNSSFLR